EAGGHGTDDRFGRRFAIDLDFGDDVALLVLEREANQIELALDDRGHGMLRGHVVRQAEDVRRNGLAPRLAIGPFWLSFVFGLGRGPASEKTSNAAPPSRPLLDLGLARQHDHGY